VAEGVAATQLNELIKGKTREILFLLRVLGTKITFYFANFTKLAETVKQGYSSAEPFVVSFLQIFLLNITSSCSCYSFEQI
jgi:hypothetical protein